MYPKLKNLRLKNVCITSTLDIQKKRYISSLNLFSFLAKRNQTLKEKWKTQYFFIYTSAQYPITEETLDFVFHTKIERDCRQICFCLIFFRDFLHHLSIFFFCHNMSGKRVNVHSKQITYKALSKILKFNSNVVKHH